MRDGKTKVWCINFFVPADECAPVHFHPCVCFGHTVYLNRLKASPYRIKACNAPGLLIFTSAQLGLIHLCTFVLLLLSGERQFAIALNSPMKNRPSTNVPPFTGTYADYLLLVISQDKFFDGNLVIFRCFTMC